MAAMRGAVLMAEAADMSLAGDDDARHRYHQMMNSIERAYRGRLDFCYANETRWPSAPFWERRRMGSVQPTTRQTPTPAILRLSRPRRETWMVGDNPEWEIVAPQRLGIYAIWCLF
jgi:hypothetical protein